MFDNHETRVCSHGMCTNVHHTWSMIMWLTLSHIIVVALTDIHGCQELCGGPDVSNSELWERGWWVCGGEEVGCPSRSGEVGGL